MITVTRRGGGPADILHQCVAVAEALAAVFGSSDDDLLSVEEVRLGFSYIADGLKRSLDEAHQLVHEQGVALRAAEKARASMLEGLGDAGPIRAAQHAPDLSEPSPPGASGDLSTRAG